MNVKENLKKGAVKLAVSIAYIVVVILLLWVFKVQLLTAIGNFLIAEDVPEKADAIFVLSGSPVDRAYKAAELFNKKFALNVVTTGSAIPTLFSAINLKITESELSEIVLKRTGIPEKNIQVYPFGTSTKQEYERILNVCKEKSWSKIIIVSDRFHTRRVRFTFKKKMKNQGIECLIVGAPSLRYLESHWWKSENGLLMVNNEYIKLIYYYLRSIVKE
jgi:uncharacterized SAM-binding protein YcdF (DUF218 family)